MWRFSNRYGTCGVCASVVLHSIALLYQKIKFAPLKLSCLRDHQPAMMDASFIDTKKIGQRTGEIISPGKTTKRELERMISNTIQTRFSFVSQQKAEEIADYIVTDLNCNLLEDPILFVHFLPSLASVVSSSHVSCCY
jgi:hypothetical protein